MTGGPDVMLPGGPRGGWWTLIRVLVVLWAALSVLSVAVGVAEPEPDAATQVLSLLFLATTGLGPLAVHMIGWPSDRTRRGRLGDGSADAVPPDEEVEGVLATLANIRFAADELYATEVIGQADHDGIVARADRLHDLIRADARSVSLGGQVSPVVMGEVESLHRRLVDLLDASIDAKALAPGDSDLDARLQLHVDAVTSQGSAVHELEQRDPRPSGRPQVQGR